ncbi:unnamed protein product, partial [Thlaspi arvense]
SLDSIKYSQRHFVKQVSSKLTPSLVSTTLLSLVKTPDLAPNFCLAIAVVSKLSSPKPALHLLKKKSSSVRDILDELMNARGRLESKSVLSFADEILSIIETFST